MLRIVCVLLALTSAAPVSADTAHHNTGNYWLPRCRMPLGSDAFGQCLAYFEGFERGMTVGIIGGGNVSTKNLVFCTPSNVSRGQAINVVVAWRNRNPHLTHNDFGWIVAAALAQAFPCR